MTSAPIDFEAELPPRERRFIVLLALLQGLLLYLAQYGMDNDVWPFDQLGGRVYWYTLVLAVPASMMMSVRTLSDRRFWQQSAGVLAVYAALSAWAVWTATGPSYLDSGAVLGPFAWTLALGSFVLLPFLQARLAHGRWCAPYPFLFEAVWQNALTMVLAGVFVALGWALLMLWGQLFKLIGIDFFADLFEEQPFIYLATGLLVGLGVLIGRTQDKPVRIARSILFALFTGLLPVLVLFSLMFLASLPFTGLEVLWKTRHASPILATLLALLFLFVNGVRQDGSGPSPYPSWLQRFVSVGVVLAPVFAVIAAIALQQRIGQYGWTVERFWAVAGVGLLTAYSFGAAWAALRRDGGWLERLAQVNVALALAMVALMVLGNSPLLDPYRIATASQVARFHAAPADKRLDVLDEDYLRWQVGRHGVLALRGLVDDPAIVAAPDRRTGIRKLLAATARHAWEHDGEPVPRTDADTLRARLAVAPGAAPLDEAWLTALAERRLQAFACLREGAECIVLELDADGDGAAERVLCDLAQPKKLDCWLSTRRGTRWESAGSLGWWSGDGKPLPWNAIRAGRIDAETACWPRISVGGLKPARVLGNASPAGGCIHREGVERQDDEAQPVE